MTLQPRWFAQRERGSMWFMHTVAKLTLALGRPWVAIAALSLAMARPVLAFDTAELMAMMAKVERSSVAFEETKNIAALVAPLVRRGRLQYIRPNTLEMQVDEPHFERLTITGERLVIETRKGKREIELSTLPIAGAWIGSVRGMLSGNLAELKRHYRLQLSGERDRWTLELHPVERSLADVVQSIEITGKDTDIARIAIEERQGDRTVLLLSHAAEVRQ